MFLPCSARETLLDNDDLMKEDRIPQDCNFDYDKMTEYLGFLNMHIYTNMGRFLQDQYGSERVKQESSLKRIKIPNDEPARIRTRIKKNVVVDETQFI